MATVATTPSTELTFTSNSIIWSLLGLKCNFCCPHDIFIHWHCLSPSLSQPAWRYRKTHVSVCGGDAEKAISSILDCDKAPSDIKRFSHNLTSVMWLQHWFGVFSFPICSNLQILARHGRSVTYRWTDSPFHWQRWWKMICRIIKLCSEMYDHVDNIVGTFSWIQGYGWGIVFTYPYFSQTSLESCVLS